jgi:hypothetical protein
MRTLLALISFTFLILCFVGCGKEPESVLSGGTALAPGNATTSFNYDEDSDTCINEEGVQGYNEELGQCADLTLYTNNDLVTAVDEGQDITASNAAGADFSGSNLDMEYLLVSRLRVDDSTVLGDGSYYDETAAATEKSNLCAKWLAKKNKKTGEYPSGIYKKIVRLNCL